MLKQLYPYCTTLNSTITTLLPELECALIRNNDTDPYINFCHSTVVAAQTIPEGNFTATQSRSQLEIVHAVIEVSEVIIILAQTVA